MHKVTYNNQEITCKFSASNVQIVDSYKIKKATDMIAIIKLIKTDAIERGFLYKRSVKSWLTEWKAHNYLYDHNIMQVRAGSVDLNEDENWLRLFGYKILSILYKE